MARRLTLALSRGERGRCPDPAGRSKQRPYQVFRRIRGGRSDTQGKAGFFAALRMTGDGALWMAGESRVPRCAGVSG
jgi:hypothetical protein